jgi:AP endonuclease-1
MARKPSSTDSDSSLSPVADDVIAQVESKVNVKTTTSGRKRKADTSNVQVTKRAKKTMASSVKTEDDVTGADESPGLKRRGAKKVKVEGEIIDDGVNMPNTGHKSKATKKTSTTRTKKQADVPLAERTEDTNLRIGAHVSTAGG